MNKNSKVLALKYRPQVFEDLIGQEVIVETIKNSLSLFFIDELTDKIQSGDMKVVKMMNKIEIPSTPTL